jgi:hypothetical protein
MGPILNYLNPVHTFILFFFKIHFIIIPSTSSSSKWSLPFTGEGRVVYKVLVGRPEGKRTLGTPRRKWEYNIRMELREIGIDGTNWIRLAQDRVQWRRAFCEHGNEPSSSIKKVGFFDKMSNNQLFK